MKAKRIVALIATAMLAITASHIAKAAPARPEPLTITQPDGSTITLYQRGDEWCHWLSDADGNLVIQAEDGFYRLASAAQIKEWKEATREQREYRERLNAERLERLHASRARMQEGKAQEGNDGDSTLIDGLNSHYRFPSRGKIRGLVVLVEYQDLRFTPEDPLQLYSDMMMKPGFDYAINSTYVHNGSANDYYYQNSNGQFDPQFDVYGPLLLKNDKEYYGSNNNRGNDKAAYEMIIEACQQLDSVGVDLSVYDNDKDGVIDFVFAIYAGEGENASHVATDVWPHSWNMTSAGVGGEYVFNGVVLEGYACTCELYKGYIDGVGTFCHEFSHVLGLPDLYDTNYRACSPSYYDLLDVGCYRLLGYCPVGFSAWERYELGWLTPAVLAEAGSDTLHCLQLKDEAFILPIENPDKPVEDYRDGEYYLFENRQNTGWDTYLPGHGMLVWHIDYVGLKWSTNSVNTWVDHQCVDLVEADGQKKNGGSYMQDESATFPGSANHTGFTDDTTPALSGWSYPRSNNSELGNRLDKPMTNIQETEDPETGLGIITFDFMGGSASIQDIEQDTTLQNAADIVLLDGRLYIRTANGSYDAMGRKIE